MAGIVGKLRRDCIRRSDVHNQRELETYYTGLGGGWGGMWGWAAAAGVTAGGVLAR